MTPIRKGDGTGLSVPGYSEVRTGDGRVLDSEPAIPDSGISRWTFDNADTDSGTALDVWNNNDGTINGPTTGQAGVSDTYNSAESYSFDDVNDSVDVGNVPAFDLQEFSFACWIYETAQGSIYWNNSSDVNGNGWKLSTEFGDLEFNIKDSNGNNNQIGTTYQQDTPLFIVASYDGATQELWIDASQAASQSLSVTISYGGDPTAFGYRPASSDRYFGGRIDDPRLYDKALTSTEISNLYNTGSIDG